MLNTFSPFKSLLLTLLPSFALAATYDPLELDSFVTDLARATTAKLDASPNERTKALSKVNRKAIDQLASTEFATFRDQVKTIFYPFAGADVYYPFTFFPKAEELVMIAIEPIGALPPNTSLSGQISTWFEEIFNYSFFKTNEMSSELSRYGCATAISVGLKAMGYSLKSLENIEYRSDAIGEKGQALNGVEITAVDQAGALKKVKYFRHDLSNGSFNEALMGDMLNKIQPQLTFLKAASYLLHNEFFSKINKMIREKSPRILQGDSGLPYRSFAEKSNSWKLDIYGANSGPIELFANRAQLDFSSLFKKAQENVLQKKNQSLPEDFSWKGFLKFPFDYQHHFAGEHTNSYFILATKK